MSFPSADMAHARAAFRAQLREKVLAEHGPLPEDELELWVSKLVSETRAAAGRKGGAGTRRRALRAKLVIEHGEQVVTMLREVLAFAEVLVTDPTQRCWHEWPAELDAEDAYCARCGLLYAEFTEDETVDLGDAIQQTSRWQSA